MKKLLYFFAACAMTLFVACEEPITPPEPPEEVGDPKEYFEQTAIDFLDCFDPYDQKETYELLEEFAYTYGEYDFDEEWLENVLPGEYATALGTYIAETAEILRSGAYYSPLSTYFIKFAQFTGEFEANDADYYWEYVRASNDFVLTFFLNGAVSEIRVKGSRDYWTFESEEVSVQVPKTVTLTFKVGNKTILSQVVKSDYNENACTVYASIVMEAANLKISVELDGNNSKLEGRESLIVDNDEILTADITINGKNLCDRSRLEEGLYNEESILNFITGGSLVVDVMKRVKVQSTIDDLYSIVYLDYDEERRSEVDKCVTTLNKAIETSFYLGRHTTKSGDIVFYTKKHDNDYYGDYWTPALMMQFTDGSKYDLETYFTDNEFQNIARRFENLIEQYQRVFDIY